MGIPVACLTEERRTQKGVNMLRAVVFASIAAFACAQWLNGNLGGFTSDRIHGMTVQYDDAHDLIFMRNSSDCYLVVAPDDTYDDIMHDEDQLHRFSENLYNQVRAGTGLKSISRSDAHDYHSRVEEWVCRNHRLHLVTYNSGN